MKMWYTKRSILFGIYCLISLCNMFPKILATGCNKPMPQKIELRDDLFCTHDESERPVLDPNEVTNVSITLLLKGLNYDMHEGALTLNFWLSVTWIDKLLIWKPEEHFSIKELIIQSSSVWNPDISVYNRLEQSGSASMMQSDHCILKNTGQISCVAPNNHKIICQPNLKYFPFDEQNCTMIIGSWIHQGEEINITTSSVPVSLNDYTQTGEWELKKVNVNKVEGKYSCCPNMSFPYININFIIERHSGLYVCVAIVPTLTMLVMTMITFFMDIQTQERIIVICSNIMLHALYAQFLGWTIPNSGPIPPLIMVFTRDSLLMTTFILILTMVQRKLIKCKKESPKWIATATGYAMNSRPVQLIFMFDGSLKEVAERLGDDDGRNIIENVQTTSTTNTDWLVLAKLMDRIAFIIYSIIYFVMCIALIP